MVRDPHDARRRKRAPSPAAGIDSDLRCVLGLLRCSRAHANNRCTSFPTVRVVPPDHEAAHTHRVLLLHGQCTAVPALLPVRIQRRGPAALQISGQDRARVRSCRNDPVGHVSGQRLDHQQRQARRARKAIMCDGLDPWALSLDGDVVLHLARSCVDTLHLRLLAR